jgi:hypothetical protein
MIKREHLIRIYEMPDLCMEYAYNYLPPLRPAPPGFPTPFGILGPDGLTIDGGRAPLALLMSGRPLLILLTLPDACPLDA